MRNYYDMIYKSTYKAKLSNDIRVNLSIIRKDYQFTIIMLINKILFWLRDLILLKY